MNELKPKLFTALRGYTRQQFIKDVIAGIIVAIIALPLSIALAIASGVNPERGLYTAIIAGFLISMFGGSRVQIGGPTATFVVIIYGIIQDFGMDGLIVASIMAGIFMIIFGLCRFGSYIKFIPYTITTGFTAGIAVGIFAGQIKDFLGIQMGAVPSEFLEKMAAYAKNIGFMNPFAAMIGALALLILILWPKVTDKIPGSLVAVIITTLIVRFAGLQVNTIGDLYDVSSKLPVFSFPHVNFDMLAQLISPAFTIAILASIESLLSCVVSDGMIGSRHRSNAELIGQGLGNIAAALFGGIPATGAIARTAANVKNGGRTPVAGMVHSVTLLLILVFLMPLAKMIPMPALAAILIMVAYNMSGWRDCINLVKKSPKSDILVFATTFFFTVIFDLVVAIEVGIVLAAILFMKRMADVTNVEGWTYIDEEEENTQDPDQIGLKVVPKDTLVYEINGPMFFGAADKFIEVVSDVSRKVVILRMRSVPAMDVSALHSLYSVLETCRKENVTLVFSHVNEQPRSVMKKAGFDREVGMENFCANIDEALIRAAHLVANE